MNGHTLNTRAQKKTLRMHTYLNGGFDKFPGVFFLLSRRRSISVGVRTRVVESTRSEALHGHGCGAGFAFRAFLEQLLQLIQQTSVTVGELASERREEAGR